MDISIIVQSCDRYEKYWDGFFYYMDKFWDKDIKCPKYFCTEEKSINSKNYIQIKTGKKSFTNCLRTILKEIKTKYVFYLLEDFWPICGLSSEIFNEIYNFTENKEIKMFQISPYTPYYNLSETTYSIKSQKVFKFDKNSDWRFNFQSRIWDKELLSRTIREPEIPEAEISSSISTEIESSKYLDKNIDVYFYHYFWYPLSGVSYRGEFTNLGMEMQNNMMVDLYGKNYSSQSSSSSSSFSSSL